MSPKPTNSTINMIANVDFLVGINFPTRWTGLSGAGCGVAEDVVPD